MLNGLGLCQGSGSGAAPGIRSGHRGGSGRAAQGELHWEAARPGGRDTLPPESVLPWRLSPPRRGVGWQAVTAGDGRSGLC